VAWSTGRLVPAPDDHSDVVYGSQTTWNGPAVVLVLVTPGAGPGRHSTLTKVPTMAKSTRGTSPYDRWLRSFCGSGVKITPPTQPGPVPSTHTVA
jgi:hypothetical protein